MPVTSTCAKPIRHRTTAVVVSLAVPVMLGGQTARTWDPDVARLTVEGVAALVEREYMDAAVAVRVSSELRQGLATGRYAEAGTPELLAEQLTRDLVASTSDRHLAVSIRTPANADQTQAAGAESREEGVRRSSGGVQRLERMAGNVGYLNLTSFWRPEEARDAIQGAMRLLRGADALILDMRDNTGGSPETVALLASYLFAQGGLELFQVVPRRGEPRRYETAQLTAADHDERRPVFVLTAARTFSAGEGLAYLLQERGRAEIVGERTFGAANPGRPYPVNDLFEVTVPNGRVRSAIGGGNWEGTGVTPDIAVPEADALGVAHVRAVRRLLARATGEWRRTLLSVAGVGEPQGTRDRAAWIEVAKSGFAIPEGRTAAELLVEMNPLLASPDPVLRDDVAYGAAERWILRERRLSPAELRLVLAQWTKNLDHGLGEAQGDRVFGRSFSALCLSVVAASDLSAPFLAPAEVQAFFDRMLDYFEREKDLRGFDSARGWMHSIAHTSDALKFLARNSKLKAGADLRLLAAVRAKLESADTVFRWGENDRIALALHAVVRRSDAQAAVLESWTSRWVEAHKALWAGGPQVSPRQFAVVENAKQVMRSLHAALSMDASPTPAGAAAAKILLAALGRMR